MPKGERKGQAQKLAHRAASAGFDMPRRSNRAPAVIVKPPKYLKEPTWGPFSARYGGTRMKVVLGPRCVEPTEYGSSPAKDTPSIMRDLLDAYPDLFIAGHLLNDNMGGSGMTAENLTPLTQTANKNHSGKVEGPIKRALEVALRRTRFNKDDTHFYGIKYTVELLPGFMDPNTNLLKHVPAGIVCSAKGVKQRKGGTDIEDLDASDVGKFGFAPIVLKTIRNKLEHLSG